MGIKETYLPHTYENQLILREYGKKISTRFVQETTPAPGFFARIWALFPTSDKVGYAVGQNIFLTYGPNLTNKAIDLVVEQFFKKEKKNDSWWSWDGWKDYISGATQTSLAETLKITFTPIAVPYLAILTGGAGSLLLPTLISLVSSAYQSVMFDPRKLQQLKELSLDKLFTIDDATGRMRDAFGRLLSAEDMQDILCGAAKFDILCKIINLCHQVDLMKMNDDELQIEMKKLLETLLSSYTFLREDGQLMYPDGKLCTPEEKQIIQTGMNILSRINPTHRAKKIRRFIKVLAKHSCLPIETLSSADRELPIQSPKRMPAIFKDKKDEWKNDIIQSSDGKYVMVKESGEKKKGALIPNEEMEGIYLELAKLRGESNQSIKVDEEIEGFLII